MAQTKGEAIVSLMREARSEKKHTQTGVNRILKACKTLVLNRADTLTVLGDLDVCRSDTGEPWRAGIELRLPAEGPATT